MGFAVQDRMLRREVGAAQARHVAAARTARNGVAGAFERGEVARAHALLDTARHHERSAEILTSIAERLARPAR
jgi:hypothetical protein